MSESKVILHGSTGSRSCVCEVVDAAEPGNKIFRFPAEPDSVFQYPRVNDVDVGRLKSIRLGNGDTGENNRYDGDKYYLLPEKLEAPPGFVLVAEGTLTPPEVKGETAGRTDLEVDRRAAAILLALEEQPPMLIRTLRRKVHADRFPAGLWDRCIQYLEDGGHICFTEGGLVGQKRVEAVTKR